MRYSKPQLTKSLRRLREGSAIATTKETRGILVTICKYEYYQDPKNYEGNNEGNAKATTAQTSGHTILKESKEIKEREEGKELKNEKNNTKEFDLKFCESIYLETFKTWLEYKKQRGESYKGQKSLEACYNKLMKYSNCDLSKMKEIIDFSMSQNYAGFFPIKTNTDKRRELSVLSDSDIF
jgi:hypothetical protein